MAINFKCPHCKKSIPTYVGGKQEILTHTHWAKNRPTNPIFWDIDKLEIGECVVIPNESREQYASMTCFSANQKFAPKRFTSRYDKKRQEGHIYRVEPKSKYDGKIEK